MADKPIVKEELGSHFQTKSLISQTDLFLGLAANDDDELVAAGWTQSKTNAVRELRDTITAQFKDKAVAREDAIASTLDREQIVTDAKVWLKRAILSVSNLFDTAPEKRDDFNLKETLGRQTRSIILRTETVLGMVKDHATQLGEWGVNKNFIKQGDDIVKKLVEADKKQKVNFGNLPEKTLKFYREKGELYLCLKRLQRSARWTFADNPVKAARYNLNILYRRPTKSDDDKGQQKPPEQGK